MLFNEVDLYCAEMLKVDKKGYTKMKRPTMCSFKVGRDVKRPKLTLFAEIRQY